MRLRRALPLALLAPLAAGPALAADAADPDWPCVQRKVDEISPGQVWSGPPLQAIGDTWQQDAGIADLARQLAARRTTVDEARPLVARFAEARGADRDSALTRLAAGVLSIINGDRASIMAGIGRYARKQRMLAERIEQQTAQLDALPAGGTAEQQAQRADLQEMHAWDTRIFEERQKSLTYVCELPVQLERRAFALGREISGQLKK